MYLNGAYDNLYWKITQKLRIITVFSSLLQYYTLGTVAKKDTATAAQAAVGCPKAAVGR